MYVNEDHLICYQGDWYIVYQHNDEPWWRQTHDLFKICRIGEEEKLFKLSELK